MLNEKSNRIYSFCIYNHEYWFWLRIFFKFITHLIDRGHKPDDKLFLSDKEYCFSFTPSVP
jgi:hypothetical protein